jgi:hypothetical protein
MADVVSGGGAGAAAGSQGLETLASAARAAHAQASAKEYPPVHLWNPPFCGDIGMRIARDGTWFYQGSPIGRLPLVKLFASILRKDPERHVLVTPVEMVSVEVEDAPFLAVGMTREEGLDGPEFVFRTNLDDETRIGPERPIRFERSAADGIKPYVLVRGGLWALVTRPLFLDLVELGEVREVEGERLFGVSSQGVFFPMAPAAEIEDVSEGSA